ncbi:MAG: exonuclease domain-containing protein [Oceanospirillaceae bacterium]
MIFDRRSRATLKRVLQHYLSLQAKRERQLNKARPGPLQDFLAVPFPPLEQLLWETQILSVDFETTGFNANHEQILSIGFTTLQRGQISLANCYHEVIHTKGNLSAKNVAIHGITDQNKTAGISLAQAVEDLLQALAGKVMLVHYAQIERTFLQRACYQLYGIAPVFPMIDTLMIAKKRKDKSLTPYNPTGLRLDSLRAEHELPQHHSHNALNDAVATAELLLAEVSLRRKPEREVLNKYLLKT